MAGFENDVGVMTNINFNPTSAKPHNGIITLDGQLLIGSTIAPNIQAGFLTGDSLITINNSPGAISLSSSVTIAALFQTGSGNATPSGNTIKILGGAGITTAGSGNTITITASGGGGGASTGDIITQVYQGMGA